MGGFTARLARAVESFGCCVVVPVAFGVLVPCWGVAEAFDGVISGLCVVGVDSVCGEVFEVFGCVHTCVSAGVRVSLGVAFEGCEAVDFVDDVASGVGVACCEGAEFGEDGADFGLSCPAGSDPYGDEC